MLEQTVTRVVSVSVVDHLEVIRINHEYRACPVVAHRLGEQAVGGNGQAAQVEQPGQLIHLGEQPRAIQAVPDVGREHGEDVAHQQHRRKLCRETSVEGGGEQHFSRYTATEEQVARGDQADFDQRSDLAQRQRRGDHRQQISIQQRA